VACGKIEKKTGKLRPTFSSN